jgi:hypothetical protein
MTKWCIGSPLFGPELQNPAIQAENVYNMDETGIQLSELGTRKVLVSRDDVSGYQA